ncbi:MAG: molybdenum cofactor biosynthesis protein B [Desulfurococcaceae archaeon TW002]
MAPVKEHREEATNVEVSLGLIITSDSILRGLKKDEITPLVERVCSEYGVTLRSKVLVSNNKEEIKKAYNDLVSSCNVVIVTGGTGLSPRDVTVEALKNYCNKDMPGFGELFRYLTFLRHGSAAIASRSFACVSGNTLLFALPGSPDAVDLALRELIMPEIRHLLYELRKT